MCEVFLMAESLIAKMVEFWGGLKNAGEWWRRSAMTMNPAFRRAMEAFIARSWCIGAESWCVFLLELECKAEEMAMIASVTDAAVYSGNQHQREQAMELTRKKKKMMKIVSCTRRKKEYWGRSVSFVLLLEGK